MSLVQDIRRNRFDFAHPYQREATQWSEKDKHLLIDSLIRNYPINPIYIVEKDQTQDYVIDGGNRLAVIYDFITNKITIPNSWPQIHIEDNWVSISGKTFSEFPSICKDRILGYPIQICNLRGATETDIKEIFARINNGVQITNAQFNAIFIPNEILESFNALMHHEIFDIILTKSHRKKASHRNFLIRIMMLLDEQYVTKNLFDYKVRKYIESLDLASNNKNIERINQISLILDNIKNIFDFICENLDRKNITMIKLPITCYAINLSLKSHKNTDQFLDWLNDYLKNFDESGGANIVYSTKNIKSQIEKCQKDINKIQSK